MLAKEELPQRRPHDQEIFRHTIRAPRAQSTDKVSSEQDMFSLKRLSRDNSDLMKAFPAALRVDALKVVSALPNTQRAADSFSVEIGKETIWIPSRIYHDPEQIHLDCPTQTQIELLACLLTRHHSGFVREEYLSTILGRNEEWAPPFVVQLVGEYVIEIVRLIKDNLHRLDSGIYQQFLIRNPAFYRTKKSRVSSYWACYYRGQSREEYAGFQVLDFFDQLISVHEA